jgi:hypothetical protein
MVERALDICSRHTLRDSTPVVVAEPYLPYMPPCWNRVLVLAEAQEKATPRL